MNRLAGSEFLINVVAIRKNGLTISKHRLNGQREAAREVASWLQDPRLEIRRIFFGCEADGLLEYTENEIKEMAA